MVTVPVFRFVVEILTGLPTLITTSPKTMEKLG